MSLSAQSPTIRRRVTVATATTPQRRFWMSDRRFRSFIGGVGSGKTYAGAVEILRQPGGSVGMVLAPTYPMLRDASLRTFRDLARPFIREHNRSEMRTTLSNGTTILWRSADDPDRLRGPNLGWCWLDEAALMQADAWHIILGRLREQPGRAWVTTTPRGRNWLHDVFASGDDDYDLIRSSTRDNIYLPDGFVDTLASAYTAEWRAQEIDGEFVDPAGALFRREWFRVVERAPDDLRWHRYWDLAASTRTSADYTASAAVALDHRSGILYIRDVVRGRWEWPDASAIIRQTLAQEPRAVHLIEEALHGTAALQELRRDPSVAGITLRGVHVHTDKLTRALPWAARAESGKVALVRGNWIPAFLDEAAMFPSGPHDDQVDSVSGGIAAIGRGYSSAVGAFS